MVKLNAALDALHDLVFDVDPRDTERLRDVLVQAVAEYRTEMRYTTAQAQQFTTLPADFHPKHTSPRSSTDCRNSAVAKMLLNGFDELNTDLMGHIEGIRDFLLTRGRVTASFHWFRFAAFEKTRARLEWMARTRCSDAPDCLRHRLRFSRLGYPTERGVGGSDSDCTLCTRDACTPLFAPRFNAAQHWGAYPTPGLHHE